MKPIVWVIFCILTFVSPCSADYIQTEFSTPGFEYCERARVSSDKLAGTLSQQMDIAIKRPDEKDWLVTDRIELGGLSCPDQIDDYSLEGTNGLIPVLLVRGDDMVYLVQVAMPVPPFPKLKLLLTDGGSPLLRFGHYSRDSRYLVLNTVIVEKPAWQVVDDKSFPGHIILACDYKWLPEKNKFIKGAYYVDTDAEEDLSLVDALRYPGSCRLGVTHTYNDSTHTTTYRFKPAGILKDKLPENLRSAKMVEVTVGPTGAASMKSVNASGKDKQ